jgi:ComF family protein
VKRVSCGLLNAATNLVFPDDCRVCGESLQEFSRIPVCSKCLAEPAPLIAEYFCVACRMPFVNRFPLDESGRCGLCRLGLQGFDAVYSYGSYEGALRELVHLFKYSGMRPLARTFGRFLGQALPRETTFDVIVPMPLHWFKQWQRGFNQSELLAREIGKKWNVPVRNVVRRKKATRPQAGLTNAKRRANVSGAFQVCRHMRSRKPLDGMRVLLVDDVVTTGATASACARVLKRAGAAQVALLALARTDRRQAVELSFTTRSAAGGG